MDTEKNTIREEDISDTENNKPKYELKGTQKVSIVLSMATFLIWLFFDFYASYDEFGLIGLPTLTALILLSAATAVTFIVYLVRLVLLWNRQRHLKNIHKFLTVAAIVLPVIVLGLFATMVAFWRI